MFGPTAPSPGDRSGFEEITARQPPKHHRLSLLGLRCRQPAGSTIAIHRAKPANQAVFTLAKRPRHVNVAVIACGDAEERGKLGEVGENGGPWMVLKGPASKRPAHGRTAASLMEYSVHIPKASCATLSGRVHLASIPGWLAVATAATPRPISSPASTSKR